MPKTPITKVNKSFTIDKEVYKLFLEKTRFYFRTEQKVNRSFVVETLLKDFINSNGCTVILNNGASLFLSFHDKDTKSVEAFFKPLLKSRQIKEVRYEQ